MNATQLPVGTKVRAVSGQWQGRTGVISKHCTPSFADRYCRVTFDLRPRERVTKSGMVAWSEILPA